MKKMLVRKTMVQTICLFMIVISISAIIDLTTEGYGHEEDASALTRGGTDHDPIFIDGNTEFTSENGLVSGDGKSSDPFIIKDWDISASEAHGIYIKNVCAFFIIENCEINGGNESYDGIVFDNVTNGVIRNCSVYGNRDGIRFASGNYPGKEESDNNLIINNSIRSNNHGIFFDHTGRKHHAHNVISSNNITENNVGINWVMSAFNWVINNNIENNTQVGLFLMVCEGGGGGNRVYHNNLMNNNGGPWNKQVTTYGHEIWNETYPLGGNYWSSFNGTDKFSGPDQDQSGADGIGDQPFNFTSTSNHYDNYPLMTPIDWTSQPPKINRPPVIETKPLTEAYMDQFYSLKITAFDHDTPQTNLTWSMDTNSTWLQFSDTQELSGTPDATDIGIYWVRVNVSDGEHQTFLKFKLTVLSVDYNLSIIAPLNYSCTEDRSFNLTCEVMMKSSITGELKKPEQGTIFWNISINTSFITIDEDTGTISGTPTNSHVGLHQAIISATDGKLSTSFSIEFLVLNVNDPPEVNFSGGNISIMEDSQHLGLVLDDIFHDIDLDDLEFRAEGSENISVEVLENGSIIITPLEDWSGMNTISVYAFDGEFEIELELNVTVLNKNDPPTIASIDIIEGDLIENANLTFKAITNDPDIIYGDNLNITWSINGEEVDYGDELLFSFVRGIYLIELKLIDSSGEEAEMNRTIEIVADPGETGEEADEGHEWTYILFMAIVLALIIILVTVFIYLRRREESKETHKESLEE